MPQAITLEQYRLSLSDPDSATAVMIANNPEAIADRLQTMGFVVSTPKDIVTALNALLEDNDFGGFVSAFTVPVRMDRISPAELEVLVQTVHGMQLANASTAKPLARMAYGSAGEGEAGEEGGGFNYNALFAGLATGVLTYLSASGSTSLQPGAANSKPPAQPAPKDNIMLIVGGIVALVVVVLVVVMIAKKK